MDEMRVKLSTKFMKSIVSKLISRAVYKKTGCKVDVQIDELDAWMFNGDITIKLNVEAKLKSDDFNKIMRLIDAD